MKELDVVLSRYLEQNYATATSDEQAAFKALLEMPDPDLYATLLGRSEIDNPELERLIRFLRGMSNRD